MDKCQGRLRLLLTIEKELAGGPSECTANSAKFGLFTNNCAYAN